jgi:NAD(P)-dependent dehydrogenase (short-subunit alcohol dehydrogenase family)
MATAVITGVSTGIGLAAARELITRGWKVFGTVRRAEDAPDFGERFLAVVADVTKPEDLRRVRETIAGEKLHALVNNAGIAVPGPLLELAEEDLRRQMEVNFFAPIAVTRELWPVLDKGSRIIMVSSVSGKMGYPFLGAYAASKHALEGASESLRRELLLHDIDVTLLCPGAIRTPIWKKANFDKFRNGNFAGAIRNAEVEMARMGARGLPVEYMGHLIAEILEGPRPRPRYTPVPNKLFNWTLPRLLPERWLDRIILSKLR